MRRTAVAGNALASFGSFASPIWAAKNALNLPHYFASAIARTLSRRDWTKHIQLFFGSCGFLNLFLRHPDFFLEKKLSSILKFSVDHVQVAQSSKFDMNLFSGRVWVGDFTLMAEAKCLLISLIRRIGSNES